MVMITGNFYHSYTKRSTDDRRILPFLKQVVVVTCNTLIFCKSGAAVNIKVVF